MKKLFLFISAVLIAGTVAAQRNYIPGTIITPQNDSLRGFIDYQNWTISPGEVRFKKQLTDAQEQHYKPADINGFVIIQPEEVYISRKVRMDVTDQGLAHLMETTTRDVQDSVVFLSRLLKGVYTLYDYTDASNRTHYIYEKEGEQPEELIDQKAYITNSTGTGLYENKAYQRQLQDLFADRPDLSKRGSRISYQEKSIVNIFIAYNSYKDPSSTPVLEKKKQTNKVHFGLMAGVSMNSYHPDGAALIVKGEYEESTNPLYGVWIDIPVGRSRRKFSVPVEIHYKSVDADGVLYNDWLTKFAFDYVQVNLLARYTYPEGLIRPYINAGLGNAFVIKTRHNEKSSNGGNSWSEAIDGPRKHEQSLIGGIGAQFRRFNAELRYAASTGFSPYSGSSFGIRSFQLIAGYRL